MGVKIAPSIVAAPQDNLGETVRRLEEAGADFLHIDIEDGVFVPVMNIGPKLIGDLQSYTDLPFDVHLMMVNPEWILPELVNAGAARIAIHLEACPYPRRTLGIIEALGAAPGLAINPSTPIPDLLSLQPYLKFVNLLSTEPELKNCSFLPSILDKLPRDRMMPGLEDIEWVIDGGVRPENLGEVVKAGADTVVVGRSTFEEDRIEENIKAMKKIIAESS